MIQIDFALAVPGTATAPRDSADVASYARGESAFQEYLLKLEREAIRLEELIQRAPRRDPDLGPARDVRESEYRSAAAERPIDSPPQSDNRSAAPVAADIPAQSDRAPSDADEAEASESADEPQPTESTSSTGAADAAAIHGPTTAEESRTLETPPLAAAATDTTGIGPQEIAARAAQQARGRAGAGAPGRGHTAPGSPGAAGQEAQGAAGGLQAALAEDDATDLTPQGKRGTGGGSGAKSTGMANPAGAGQSGSPTPLPGAADPELAFCGEPATSVSQDGSPLDESGTGHSPRSGTSRGNQRRLVPAGDGASADLQNGLLETTGNGAPSGAAAATARLSSQVSTLAALLADSAIAATPSTTAEFAATAVGKVAAIEGDLAIEGSTAAAPVDRLADSFAEHSSGPGKSGGATDRGMADPSVHAADRQRFVQRVMHALQAAEARGTAVRLRLSPPDLGSLRLELTMRKNALLARVEVETAAAQALLLDSLQQLRERLAAQEIKIERFEVDLMNHHAGDWPHGARDQEHAGNAGRRGLPAGSEDVPAQGEAAAPPVAVHLPDAGGINVLV